jgi:hypothetical protein
MTSGRDMYRNRFGTKPQALGEAELPLPIAAILNRRSQRAFKPAATSSRTLSRSQRLTRRFHAARGVAILGRLGQILRVRRGGGFVAGVAI